jgi:hypothetical protein
MMRIIVEMMRIIIGNIIRMTRRIWPVIVATIHRDRLRARFSEAGGDALPDYELLETVRTNRMT